MKWGKRVASMLGPAVRCEGLADTVLRKRCRQTAHRQTRSVRRKGLLVAEPAVPGVAQDQKAVRGTAWSRRRSPCPTLPRPSAPNRIELTCASRPRSLAHVLGIVYRVV